MKDLKYLPIIIILTMVMASCSPAKTAVPAAPEQPAAPVATEVPAQPAVPVSTDVPAQPVTPKEMVVAMDMTDFATLIPEKYSKSPVILL